MKPARYTAVQPGFVRAPLLPVECHRALVDDPDAALADPRVRAAVAVAAPALLTQLDRADLDADSRARARRSLQRYGIRMTTRPTPFGLFAGVGLAPAGPGDLALGGRHRSRMRPDLGWLCALVAALEARPTVRQQLRMLANPEITRAGGRVRLAAPAALDGTGDRRPVSLRATPVVELVLSCARKPVGWADLAAAVRTATGAGPEPVQALLDRLWEQTFLLTELRPALTHPAPALRLAGQLAGLGDAAEPERTLLGELLAGMAEWDSLGWHARPAAGARLAALAERGVPGADRYAQVDLALDLTGTLPAAVGDSAARAAEVLLRLGPPPGPGLAPYLARFVDRYGTDRDVDLLEMLDPERGLGPPDQHAPAAAQRTPRDAWLLATATAALRDRRQVVTLDRAALDALGPPLEPALAPPSVDLSVLVLATSAADLAAGRFRLLVGPNLGAQAAGRNLGRFASLLGPDADAVLGRIADAVRQDAPDALHAELVYLPPVARSANVALRPAGWDHEVVLGVSPGVPAERAVPLSELRVAIRDGRFQVRWPGHPGELVVHAGHMLSSRVAPPAVRFLEEVARAGRHPLRPLSWGAASGLPFLPRIEAGRAILAPAQWRIDGGAAAALAPRSAGFEDRLARWRAEWDVPRRVYLAENDNRLLLDLESPGQVRQLADALRRLPAGLVLQEPVPDLTDAWLPGPGGTHHVCEVVVPLVRTPATPAAPPADDGPAAAVTARDRLRGPGSDWLYLKVYGPIGEQDDLLTGPVRELVSIALGAGLADRWFFLRYADPDPHLRIRFGGEPGRLVALIGELAPLVAELLEDGRCLRASYDTYDREVERYGGLEAIGAAEDVFAADSDAVLELLALLRNGFPLDRTALGVLAVDDLLAGLGLDAGARLAWLRGRVRDRRASGAEYRARGAELRRMLTDPAPGLLEARRDRLRAPAGRYARLAAAGRLTRPWPRILDGLVHMHANRFRDPAGISEEHLLGLLLRTRESLTRM